MFVADLGGEVAMGLRRLPTLANHCAQRASFALLQGKWIEFRELTYIVGKSSELIMRIAM
jgi:recombinational DNA repair protein RecR